MRTVAQLKKWPRDILYSILVTILPPIDGGWLRKTVFYTFDILYFLLVTVIIWILIQF